MGGVREVSLPLVFEVLQKTGVLANSQNKFANSWKLYNLSFGTNFEAFGQVRWANFTTFKIRDAFQGYLLANSCKLKAINWYQFWSSRSTLTGFVNLLYPTFFNFYGKSMYLQIPKMYLQIPANDYLRNVGESLVIIS